jgi:hypothetical protein
MRKKIDCRRVDDFDLEDKYCSVAAAVVGSAVVGGVMQGKAASKAANAQESAANQANETQRYMYDTTREDNAPFLKTGTAANQKLAYLLGIGGSADGGAFSSGNISDGQYEYRPGGSMGWQVDLGNGFVDLNPETANYPDLNNKLAEKKRLDGIAQTSAQSDPSYGSLLKNFSATDLENDPIYQSTFQNALDTGTKAANQQASATGSLLSGNTLKALTRFGANTAATYGNDAYNRYNTNQSNVYNRLAGVSGSGQVASGQVGAAGQNMANQVSQNQIGIGNARGASAIAQGNAFNNALSTGVNAYQQQNYLNQFGVRPQQAGAPVTDLSFPGS